MRYYGLDLNLLAVLDALYAEQHVTRAASRLNLTQSAVSAALGRLREHFADPLFVLVGGRMLPTALMQGLYPQVTAVLAQAREIALASVEFDPLTSCRRFRLVASDYVIAVLMPALKRRLSELAPNLELAFSTLALARGAAPGDVVADALEVRGDDLVIIPRGHCSSVYPLEPLFSDDFTVIACAHNIGLACGLSQAQYLSMAHVVREISPELVASMEAEHLASLGLNRRVAVAVDQFGLIPEFVSGSDYIATLHSRLARQFASRFDLQLLAPPLEFPATRQVLQWHPYQEADPALIWLRQQLHEVVAEV